MTQSLYFLMFFTTLVCAVLLLRAWVRVRQRLLLWSGLCFAGFAVNNLLVIADLVWFPEIDFFTYRLETAAVATLLLLYGLVWESR